MIFDSYSTFVDWPAVVMHDIISIYHQLCFRKDLKWLKNTPYINSSEVGKRKREHFKSGHSYSVEIGTVSSCSRLRFM